MNAIKNELEKMGIRCTADERSAVIVIPERRTGLNAAVRFDYDGTPRGFAEALAEYAENYDADSEADARIAMHYITSTEILRGVSRVVDDARKTKEMLKNAAKVAMTVVRREEREAVLEGRTSYVSVSEQFSNEDNKFYKKKPLPDGVKRRPREEYNIGDIVYTDNGVKYRILYMENNGMDVDMEYMEGPRAGLLNFIYDAVYLYK